LWRQMHSVLRIEKKFFAMALSYGLSFLDMEGVMLYASVRLKYACEVYCNSWSLWRWSYVATLFFSYFIARRMVFNTRLTVWCVPVL